MRPLAPLAAKLAPVGHSAVGHFGKVRKTRDIVNFVNFISAHILLSRRGAAT